MARLDGADANNPRFAGIKGNTLSAAKRYFVAEGRIAVPFMAWFPARSRSALRSIPSKNSRNGVGPFCVASRWKGVKDGEPCISV